MRKVGHRSVVVPIGEASKYFQGMINLNETGAFLWSLLIEDTTEERLLEALLAEYDVSRQWAEESLHSFLHKLTDAGVLDET